jgi:hypothetical protein
MRLTPTSPAKALSGLRLTTVSYLVVACTGRAAKLLAVTYAVNVKNRSTR